MWSLFGIMLKNGISGICFALVLTSLLLHSHYLDFFPGKHSHSQETLYEDIVCQNYVARNSVKDVIALSTVLKRMNVTRKCFNLTIFLCHWFSSIIIFFKQKNTFGYTVPPFFIQGNCCNNLTTTVIPFFIVSKSSVGKAVSKKPLYHIFLRTPLPRYWRRHNLQSPQKLFFQACLDYISVGCSLCTDHVLIKQYGFKMQGK